MSAECRFVASDFTQFSGLLQHTITPHAAKAIPGTQTLTTNHGSLDSPPYSARMCYHGQKSALCKKMCSRVGIDTLRMHNVKCTLTANLVPLQPKTADNKFLPPQNEPKYTFACHWGGTFISTYIKYH